MSQITRCPSCATMFKVVADQLRISDGWVRCGQCKEVFDASAHLLTTEPLDLLPDVSMAGAPPPPTPVARATDAGRNWGTPAAAANLAAASVVTMPPVEAHVAPWEPPAPDDVLEVPVPAAPAFLVTETAAVSAPEMELTAQPASPLAWRSVVSAGGAGMAPLADAQAPAIPADAEESPTEMAPAAQMDGNPAGYELPSAELSDTEWPEELPDGNSAPSTDVPDPPLELLRKPSAEKPAPRGLRNGGESEHGEISEETSDGCMPLEQDEDDPSEEAWGADEVSFVRAAKRKAFWRNPLVRLALGVVLVVLLCTLALQAVLQERDRIAAADSRARPWLQMLCVPFQCALAPLRQIADIMIDSSSFNKGRGDSYHLTFALKNRATVPLAMPAIELTLTDAQEQPVLRRVFLPHEMKAPAELPALSEWTTSVAVIVTTGGARVAGYRLVAFYP
jgi:predicted Zn finger-like uncharacterized protein